MIHKTFKHKNGYVLSVLESEGKTIAVPKETFDREFDPNYTDVQNVTVIDEVITVEAEPFPSFESCNTARVRDVVGLEKFFRITDDGMVLSKTTDKIMSTVMNPSGYEQFWTNKTEGQTNRGQSICVHRLVAKAFVPNSDDKPQINHLDGDKNNNHYSNLEWCTGSENMKHAVVTGLMATRKGPDAPSAKLTANEVREIRSLINTDIQQKAIAEKYGVSSVTIWRINRNVTHGSVL